MARTRSTAGVMALKLALLTGLVGSTGLLGGCSAGEGALWGAWIGALIGQDAGSAGAGAAVGAGIGYAIGSEYERATCHCAYCRRHYYDY